MIVVFNFGFILSGMDSKGGVIIKTIYVIANFELIVEFFFGYPLSTINICLTTELTAGT